MLEKFILPLFVAVIGGLAVFFAEKIDNLITPNNQVVYEISEPSRIFGSSVTKSLFQTDVNGTYLTQIRFTSTGKQEIIDFNAFINLTGEPNAKLFRVFYTTNPENIFNKVTFKNHGEYSQYLTIEKFVEGTSILVSVISSNSLNAKIEVSKSKLSLKEKSAEETNKKIITIALFAALFTIIGRFVLDILGWTITRISNKSN